MRDPYIDVCKEDESACHLTSVFSLSVLASTWRMRASYSSLVELSEASVMEEDSGSFHCLSTLRMALPFVISRSAHPGSSFRCIETHLASVLRCYAMQVASGAAEMILI